MRESRFIDQNLDKWRRYEEEISSEKLSAEDMESAFVELNDDLAYARTFYKNRAIRLFLNNLLAPVYSQLLKVRKWNLKSTGHFFSEVAPAHFFSARKFIFVSFITVLLGFFIGYFSTRFNPEFAGTILGKDYVLMTEANIAKGDPLAVYKQEAPGPMFSYIASNNLKVAAYFFLLGALFCVGAMYLLLSNGIMLGAFTYLFTSRGLTADYLLTVYQHGTLEMLSMVVEGAAGIMLGSGLLFPGTLTRSRSVQNAAKKSILMLIVCIPIIILAAFIESYLTRFTEINNFLRSVVIILSLLFMVYYFIIYPFIKFRKTKKIEGNYDDLTPETDFSPRAGEIYGNNTIVLFGFDFIKRNALLLFLISALSLFVLYPVNEYLSDHAITRDLSGRLLLINTDLNAFGDAFRGISRMFFFNNYASCYVFSGTIDPWIAINSSWLFVVIFYVVFTKNKGLLVSSQDIAKGRLRIIFASLFSSVIISAINYFSGSWWWFMSLLFFPLLVFSSVLFVSGISKNPVTAIVIAIRYFFASTGRILGNVLLLLLLHFMFMFGSLYLSMVLIMVSKQFHGLDFISQQTMYMYVWMNYLIVPFVLSIAASNSLLLALSVHEINTGSALNSRIEKIGFKKEYFGLETE